MIRIGSNGLQAKTYIAGISTAGVIGGVPVYVTSNGQLGFSASSERYKTDIKPLTGDTDRLSKLHPVSFHVDMNPNGATQFGLIGEAVDRVYLELVIRDAQGKVQCVRYHDLAPIPLSQVQKQQATVVAQAHHAALSR